MNKILVSDRLSLVCCDNIQYSKTLDKNSIQLTVTSPPYDNLRNYTGSECLWDMSKTRELAVELLRITRDGGVVVWNTCDQTVDGSESGSSFRQALCFMECGFLLADTMIYKKINPGGARGSNKTYLQCFEYMFVFSKGKIGTHNLLKDRLNKFVGSGKGGGRRNRDGSVSNTKMLKSEEFGRRTNIWEYATTSRDEFSKKHPAPFPYALAEDHILSWSNEGDVVFDPFSGSGTTCLAAIKNNRTAIGVDVSEEYCEIARQRLEKDESLAMFGL